MIDQIRAIGNTRLMHKIGQVDDGIRRKVKENISIVLDLD